MSDLPYVHTYIEGPDSYDDSTQLSAEIVYKPKADGSVNEVILNLKSSTAVSYFMLSIYLSGNINRLTRTKSASVYMVSRSDSYLPEENPGEFAATLVDQVKELLSGLHAANEGGMLLKELL